MAASHRPDGLVQLPAIGRDVTHQLCKKLHKLWSQIMVVTYIASVHTLLWFNIKLKYSWVRF